MNKKTEDTTNIIGICTSEEMGMINDALTLAVQSSARMQNSKSALPEVKQAHKIREQKLHALQAKLAAQETLV